MPDTPADKAPKQRNTRAKRTAQSHSSTSQRAQKRRQGQRPSLAQKKKAKATFLTEFAKGGVLLRAAEMAGVDRHTIYDWLEKDEEFLLRYHQAEQDASDVLLAEAWRRAVHGIPKPALSGGRWVHEQVPLLDKDGELVMDKYGKPMMIDGDPVYIQEYSDSLMLALLKARRPEFKDKSAVELSGPNGGPIQQQQLGGITPNDLREIAKDVATQMADWRKGASLPLRAEKDALT